MILFFYGSEQFRPRQKIAELRRRFLDKNPTGTGFVQFDLTEDEVDSVCQELPAASLFTQRRLIVLLNPFTPPAEEQRKLADALVGVDDDTVVVVHESTNPRKNSILFRKLLEIAHQSAQFEKLLGKELENWVLKYLANLKPTASITREALNLLLARAGDDLYNLRNQLDKLSSFCDKIDSKSVQLLVPGDVQGDMFAAIEALTSSNRAQALQLLERQLLSGDDPHKILAMYVYQVRSLLSVGSFLWSGNTNSKIIATKAKLHPFVVSKAIGALRNLSSDKLLSWHRNLADIDHSVKVGTKDIRTALSLFVANACRSN